MSLANDFPYAPILAETSMSVDGKARNYYATAGWMARDEFAAHAPAVPSWFAPEILNEKDRFFAWRWAYADAMLSSRNMK